MSDEPDRFFVDRIMVNDGNRVERLAEGDGWASARFGADLALYLDLKTSERPAIRRYPTATSTTWEAIMPGLSLI